MQVNTLSARRFEWVLEGLRAGPVEDFDVDLLDDPYAALVPTRGSLVTGWTLLIPRAPSLSLAALPDTHRARVLNLRARVTAGLAAFHHDVAWFEHGSSLKGSPIGCGVDQAHLHAVPLDFDLSALALRHCEGRGWIEVDALDPFAAVDPSRDYYYVGHKGRHFVLYPRQKVSQFFRRLIASEIGS